MDESLRELARKNFARCIRNATMGSDIRVNGADRQLAISSLVVLLIIVGITATILKSL